MNYTPISISVDLVKIDVGGRSLSVSTPTLIKRKFKSNSEFWMLAQIEPLTVYNRCFEFYLESGKSTPFSISDKIKTPNLEDLADAPIDLSLAVQEQQVQADYEQEKQILNSLKFENYYDV